MNYKFIILGILCWIVALWIFPLAKKRIQNDELNHLTLKGIIMPIILFILGFYLLARELAEIL
tara:strand:- start:2129 stop:2317 length:189 start_codon:yes stop_codon:yes gene_type:complete